MKYFGITRPMSIACISLMLIFVPLKSLKAAEQADRAIKLVNKMIERGTIARGTTLTIAVKQGNINNFWGINQNLRLLWENQTGTVIDTIVIPQKPVKEFLEEAKNVDITVARQREYPDLVYKKLISDITGMFDRYGFSLTDNLLNGYIDPEKQAKFNNKIYAVPADGDIAVLYLRSDLLEDPENQKRYRKQFSAPLAAPATWDEYLRQIQFFHRPETAMYGSCEQRNPASAWMFWIPRYVSLKVPNLLLFDDDMHPLIDSVEGVKATQSYLDTIAYSPPNITEQGNNYSFTVPIFRQANCFSMIITLSLAKLLNQESSAVRGKFKIYEMPGWIIDKKTHSRTSYIYGNNLVIPAQSKNKDLAFLYSMWFTDPDISLQSIMVESGIADPYRYNHFSNEQVAPIYSRQALDATLEAVGKAVPAGTGLPGDSEYIAALNKYLWSASKNEISPEQAMHETAVEWENITEKYGREMQKMYWNIFKQKFPQRM